MLDNTIAFLYNNRVAITNWLHEHGLTNISDVFYSSIDVRHSNEKITLVDMNLFPGGFNNINEEFYPLALGAIEQYMTDLRIDKNKLILLIPENHTRNSFYTKNIAVIRYLLLEAGYKVILGSIGQDLSYPEDDMNESVKVVQINRIGNSIIASDGQKPDIIILNNDLSAGLPEILNDVEQPIIPSILSGWYTRLKSQFFTQYDLICKKFATDFNLDSWIFTTKFQELNMIDFNNPDSLNAVQLVIDKMFMEIKDEYRVHKIDKKPFLMIKADNGTYGMGIMSIEDNFNFTKLNRKDKNKMATIKDGWKVNKLIVQEGVESILKTPEGHTAEPVIYSIGNNIIGGFYRVNNIKGIHDNLNSNGMYFTQMAPQDIATPIFFSYALLAKLSIIAAKNELKLSPSILS